MEDDDAVFSDATNDTPATTVSQKTTTNISTVYARLPVPQMSNTNIEAWFVTMDFWFVASGIIAGKQKTATVLAALDPNVIAQLSDVIASLHQTDRFAFIKKKVIEHFADSEQRRLNRLLSELPLGDRKPSDLYFEMKRVAGNTLGEAALKGLWTKRLPEAAQPVVAASSGTPAEFTKIADSVIDAITPNQRANQVALNADIADLRVAVAEICKQLDKLNTRQRSRSRSNFTNRYARSGQRGVSETRSASADDECWFHRKFGRNAKRCRSPCRFKHRLAQTAHKDSSEPSI